MAETGFRVTYATMSADDDAMHESYDRGIEEARSWLGGRHPFLVNGEQREGQSWAETRSPIDREVVIGTFAEASRQDVDDAISAAQAFAPEWAATPWDERVRLLRKAADLISERRSELSALMAIEVGKNRLEALGDVEETADLIRYYCHEMERNDGFAKPMGQLSEAEKTRDVMRPYGVWGVISPFNFPMALAGGPSGAALVAGNTVVLKPSGQGYFTGLKLGETLLDAGVPPGAFQVLPGKGSVVGAALVEDARLGGITFTGSYEVGMGIYRSFTQDYPRPVICEMGGKNPAIVTAKADLEKAAEGIMRSAFGFGGQKCSAASRAYVEASVRDDLISLLLEKTAAIEIGDPLERGVWLGPVIDEKAVARFEEAVAEARSSGEVLLGGERLDDGDLARGNFVQPTIVTAPRESWLWKRELFVPFISVDAVSSLDEALELANDTEYGLTAGFFSEDRNEIDRFLDGIEAGVVYVNRRAGATTGAWPGVQPFGGWKGSGTSGKAGGGDYYVQQFMREQSQTVVAD